MKTFRIVTEWIARSEFEIEAESLDEAQNILDSIDMHELKLRANYDELDLEENESWVEPA